MLEDRRGVAIREVLTAVVILCLLGSLLLHRSTLRGYRSAVEGLEELAHRSAVRDGVLGLGWPTVSVRNLVTGQVERLGLEGERAVVWIVAPDDCNGCLTYVDDWNASSWRDELRKIVIFSGISAAEADRMRHGAGLGTEVVVDSGGVLFERLDLEATSIVVAIDEKGTIVLAEGSQPASECGWNFLRQVAVLFGLEDSRRIRS